MFHPKPAPKPRTTAPKSSLWKNTQIDMAVLDFSKAFDTVPHKRLLGKLSFYGVKGDILCWVQAFLEDREQKVVVDGRSSSSEAVTSGVPQGTVLAPLLFLLYINDLPSVVSSQERLFADDCLMYRPIRSVEDQVAMQRNLDSLERWGDTWGMRFNAKKCHIMTLGRGRSTLMHFCSLCGEILSSVDEAKYLGINISHDLSWSPHVQSLCSRGNSTLGFLRRNLRRCPAKLKEQSYIALVRSVLDFELRYGIPILPRISIASRRSRGKQLVSPRVTIVPGLVSPPC